MTFSQPWQIERRADGTIVVRVSSCDRSGNPLPDAVFAFHAGDSQYAKWDSRLREIETGAAAPAAPLMFAPTVG